MSVDHTSENCIFCKIVLGQIPSRKLFEDEDVLAFHDIEPLAPVHVLLIPKLHIATLSESDSTHEPLLGKMLALAPRLAREAGSSDGFRTIINTGRIGGQEVYHLHLHIIGGPVRLPAMLTRG
jgi:histidine triad (HIT) family protein